MANEAYKPMTAQDLIKMYNLDALIADREKTKVTNEKIKTLEQTSNSLKDFAEEVEKQIEDLEKIADGKITTYYYSGVPTLNNYPANEWAIEEYENHIGDMYYDKETGFAYKFLFDNETNEYLWRKETNPELSEALAKANNALEAANNAQTIANDAKGVASGAQSTASSAQSTASQAQETANMAQSTATQAQNTANNAKDLADSAQSVAEGAQSTANIANQTANTAQNVANDAKETAEGAQTTANTAKDTAEGAQNLANTANNTANTAQQTANQAQTTAGMKMQVFVDTPYPPYQIGDLWLKDDKEIYRCRATKTSGSFSMEDWKLGTDFTNDDYAKNVEEELNVYKEVVSTNYVLKATFEENNEGFEQKVQSTTTKITEIEGTIIDNNNNLVTQIEDLATKQQIDEVNKSVTQLQTDSFTKTEIQKIVSGTYFDEQGNPITVTSLKTNSAKFDEDGMHYSQDGAPTNSTINHRGLTVEEGTETGVNAKDLLYAGYVDQEKITENTKLQEFEGQTVVYTKNTIVDNYFVMGSHSRMEDYEDGTGIFYI